MPFGNSTVAFIGAGVMGEAFIKGLLKKQLLMSEQIIAADVHADRGKTLVERYPGLRFTSDNVEATESADILVLSVKPQALGKVLSVCRGKADSCSLILSIVAGAPMRRIADDLLNARVVRAMPNTPGQIGQGITVWTAAPGVQELQHRQAEALLGALGEQIYVEEERFLDMATALSGTGPAYVFLFMEALVDAGVHMGFSRRDAEKLVLQTLRGSVEYALESKLHPAELRNQVTSPGGTTASALYQLEKGGLRTVIARAIWAAYQRSAELGSGTEKLVPNGGDGN